VPRVARCLKSHNKDWQANCSEIAKALQKELDQYWSASTISTVLTICEQPKFLASRSVTATTGGLVKMAHLSGLLSSVLPNFNYVDINAWKGNLSKEIVIERIKHYYRHTPRVFAEWQDDAWDAVGIGLHHFGEF